MKIILFLTILTQLALPQNSKLLLLMDDEVTAPNKIDGLVLWLKADSANYTLESGAITNWDDLSEYDNDAVQLNTSLAFTTANNMVVLNGSKYAPLESSISLSNTYTIIITYSITSTSTFVHLGASGTANYTGIITSDIIHNVKSGSTITAPVGVKPDSIGTYEVWRNGTSAKIYLNNRVLKTSIVTTDAQTINTIGATAEGNFKSVVKFKEIIIYNRPLSDNERTNLYNGYISKTLGRTTKHLVLCDGNSLTYGIGGTAYPMQLQSLLGNNYRALNHGTSGTTISTMKADSLSIDFYYSNMGRKNILVCWGGTNDMSPDSLITADSVFSMIKTYCSKRKSKGWKVAVLTILPRQSTAPNTPTNFESRRITVNDSIRTNYSDFADGLVDVALDDRIGDIADLTNTTYYNSDKTHLTTAGYEIIASLVYSVIKDW